MEFKKISLILLFMIILSACNSDNKDKTEIKTLDKAPDTLVEVNEGIRTILENVGKIERIKLDINYEDTSGDDSQEESMGKESEQPNSGSNEGGPEESEGNNVTNQESSQEGAGDDGDKETSDEEKDNETKRLWGEIDKSLEEIYLKWSGYENEGIKKGGSKDRAVQLQQSINKLTQSIEERDIVGAYDHGSQSILNLKPFYDLYKDEYRGEICDIESSIYQYYIKANANDIGEAKKQIESKEENISRIRMLIGDDKKKNEELDKIATSLQSIGISLDEGSKRVYLLEKDTLIKNLKSLE